MLMMDECHYEQRRIVAYLDNVQARLASRKGMISLREIQSATGEELRRRRTLLPSVLRPSGGAFKGEL
jgi:hypothetical protein